MIGIGDDTIFSFERDKEQFIRVAAGTVEREGIFFLPENTHGLVILAQGIEDATHGPHQRALALAGTLQRQGLATFIVDLFSSEEQALDNQTGYFRQNVDIMQQRIIGIADWFQNQPATEALSIGYFGMDEAGAAALIAAAERPDLVAAVVSAGSALDQALPSLPGVLAHTLLIAGEKDTQAIQRSQEVLNSLTCTRQLAQLPGVASLHTDPKALDALIQQASAWFTSKLTRML